MDARLDDSAPLISPDGIPFALVPTSLGRELYRSALRTIAECRDRAQALAEAHRYAIISLATTLYAPVVSPAPS